MIKRNEPYRNANGDSVDCIMIQAAAEPEGLWMLVVTMDNQKESKKSQLFHTPSLATVEPVVVFETDTWIGSFWVSPSGVIYAADGASVWSGPPGAVARARLADRSTLHVWGMDDQNVFVLGNEGLVLRLVADGWADISIPEPLRLHRIRALNANRLYAVGEAGALYRLDQNTWTQLPVPTNASLRGVYVAGDEDVYACGESAVALRYQAGRVDFLGAEPNRDFADIAAYKNRLFFGATNEGVDVLSGTDVVPFKNNIYGQRLWASAEYLYSCGANFAYRHDGSGWIMKEFL